MNGGKFASLTAELLVRKGEARPSQVVNFPLPHALAPRQRRGQTEEPAAGHALAENEPREERAPAEEPKPAASCREANCGKPPPPTPPGKPRRLMVTLTATEFETLGHMGVKKGATRHQLLRNALDEYMALLGEEFGGDCQCIYTGCSCDNPR